MADRGCRAGRFLEAPASHKARLAQVGSQLEAALVRGLAVRHEYRMATPAALVDDLMGRVAPRPVYSDAQVRAIVNRAAELEASNPTSSGAMTIGGLEAIAAGAGIPADMVRAAAESMTPPSRATRSPDRSGGSWRRRRAGQAALLARGTGRQHLCR